MWAPPELPPEPLREQVSAQARWEPVFARLQPRPL
jgi:hypothetical protein